MIAAIFTGGASSRFGSDKALAMGGIVRDAARGAGCDPVVAVGGTAGDALGLITVPDRRPGEGPLAALGSILLWAGPERVLTLPCDLALLAADHLIPLLDAAASPHTAPQEAVVAQVNGVVEHSVAIWPGSMGRTVWQAVERGDRALRVALDLVRWRAVDIAAEALRDADTPTELAELTGHLGQPLSPPTPTQTTRRPDRA